LGFDLGVGLLMTSGIIEVAQQSKARRKDDFLIAFSPVIAEATATAYKGATNEVQQKLRRVVEVWRTRQIFEPPIQEAIEARIDGTIPSCTAGHPLILVELDKSRSSTKKGGSIFSSNPNAIPSELAPLVAPQQTLSKLVLSTKTSLNAASQDYDKLTDPNTTVPSAPVHAARLNGLLKTLANAEGAVAESIKARSLLIEGLEKILETNRDGLKAEEKQLRDLTNRKTEIDNKKKDVEDSIMRGFASNSNPSTPAGPAESSPGQQHSPVTPGAEPDRPEVEALTPPGYPQPPATGPVPEFDLSSSNGNNGASHIEQSPIPRAPSAGSDLLSSLSTSYVRPPSATGAGSAKKRKLNDDFPDLGGDDGLDADVAEMLRRDSGGNGF
jgi:regulator of Ty1 transposition protein 103